MTHKIQQESIKKRLAKLAAPIFIETLLIMMLGAVDTIMLSRHSDNSVAAVGVVNQIIMLTFLVFEVINLGTSVLCSQYLGAKLEKKVVQVVGVSLLVNLVVGGTISLFLYSMNTTILGWMGLGPELMADGAEYMRIVGSFAFFQAISLTLSASLRSANKAIYPMLVTVVVNIVNIIGNYSLIFGKFGFPELGVEGAAISTAFSRGVAMVILFIILFRKHIHRFPLVYFRPFPWIELKNLMKVGLPSAGEQLSYSSSQVVITFFINMLGVEALATRTYCVNIIMFVYLFSISMAQGGAICIGHLIGEKKPHAAFLLGKYVMKKSVMITFILSCILPNPSPMADISEITTTACKAECSMKRLYNHSINIIIQCANVPIDRTVTYHIVIGILIHWHIDTLIFAKIETIYARTKLLCIHFILYQRRTKMMPRMFSSSKKATHIPHKPQPQ